MKPLAESDPRQVGPYRTLAELGRGGMGRVLLGSSPDGRLVAIKLVRDVFTDDEGFRARFRHEVAASRRVSGAYTAPVLDADPDAPTPWLASAFVHGPSLQQAVDQGGVLPEEPALRLAAGLAAALAEVHRTGLVHRDLKPANVLLAEDGPRVIDFGIARATEPGAEASRLTHTGWFVGSPPYMSPEQAEGAELTPAADVFSLGSVLVMACTGGSPFAGTSAPQALYRVVHTEPDLAALPPRLRRVAAACLAKDPDERPGTAELRELIGEMAASARPWPAPVAALIAEQRAGIARILDEGDRRQNRPEDPSPQEADTGPGSVAGTAAETAVVPAPALEAGAGAKTAPAPTPGARAETAAPAAPATGPTDAAGTADPHARAATVDQGAGLKAEPSAEAREPSAEAPTITAGRSPYGGLPPGPEGRPADRADIAPTPTLIAGAPRPPASPSRRTRAVIGAAAALAVLAGLLAWAMWPSSHRSCGAATGRQCAQLADPSADPSDGTDGTGSSSAGDKSGDPSDTSSTTAGTTPPPTPTVPQQSWDSSSTDHTPFTQDALLAQRFTDDENIEFARVAGGRVPCNESGSPALVAKLAKDGCQQVMTGAYLEQPGPAATPENPVLVSVQVFAFPDTASASAAYAYLEGAGRWNLTLWCAASGVGHKPCDSQDHGLRVETNRQSHRYVVAVQTDRTDITGDKTIQPWLDSAARAGAAASGPQNYQAG